MRFAFFATVAWLLVACTSSVHAPVAPVEPTSTFLLRSGRHRGLWLPLEEGGFVEYGYGDWGWFAKNRDSWYHAPATLLWPTRGTLARRFEDVRDGEELRELYHWVEISELVVSRERVERLRDELEAQFAQEIATQHFNERYDLDFVHHSERYWIGHNCNDQVATWLEALGCRVERTPLRLDLVVEPGGRIEFEARADETLELKLPRSR